MALAYVAAAWLLIQVAETLFPVFGLSDTAIRLVVIILAIGYEVLWDSMMMFDLFGESDLAVRIGDKDEAFRLLDKHNREDTWQIRSHLGRPWYRKLHDDPR